ncbi:ROK family protein [Halococcus saccharolyticus]|uniref:Glucokinase n=1 Tax=Halococcus saccharolyticus DSM 5350 TaxID=1227455 RepID=M0MKN2_9EURY|nr:ROK family protein [Halococcus saccharolyticus]EMA46252.1 glucokinase [Halococcus saccharolyticus DSM 5350]
MARYAGVDLGGTNVRAVVADADGKIDGSDKRPVPPDLSTGLPVTDAILDCLREACLAADTSPEAIEAVGVAAAGRLDPTEGIVEPTNIAVDTVPLTGPISNLVDSDRIHLHKDVAAGVIGERYHAERNPDDMVYLTISSGIGAGVTVDGSVLKGWDSNAGEVGHYAVDPAGRLTCGCGHDGHWEAYCSGSNIPAYARLLWNDADRPATALPIDEEGFDAVDVFAHAREDAFAEQVVDRLAEWNAMGVAGVVHAYAPLVISVGGAVALNNEALVVDPIRDRLDDLVMTNVPEVRLTEFGDDVVVRGALASALTDGTGDPADRRE